ncbi:amidohydrolase family protein [Defluviitalea raffinosedens]|jgi:hypothetical protein|uniref:Amidohydrolase family protein n=1 Tax=Defluviitalea raffinosedens TaxID=1450156 RepID=A0A7C8HI72_9FIRM|nr:amidohydrolase family protein [Defluviitalea raffinosedens]KAE9635395.1 amidohydrolase family protein [Defluviitalea raffinosedens]HHW67574.1 amidohydrolase family protein [Candidatus Epulonipiscium sp.]
MIIDVHTHCFDNVIAKKAISVLSKKSGIPAHTDGTVSDLIRSMDESHIDISVIQPIATKPKQTEVINRWGTSINNERIISFGTIHPEYPNWKSEIRYLASCKVKGIKFHPDYQEFFVDDPKLFPIYEEVFSHNMIALFHAGIDIGLPEPCHCTPKGLRNIVRTFKGARIIAAHMGGCGLWNEVEKYLVGEDIYFDTSYTSHALDLDFMTRIIKNHGVDQILFGTDSPWGNQDSEVEFIRSLPLNDEDKDKILGKNAIKVLGLQL